MLTPKRRLQRGYSLAEILVAIAIFAVIVIAALAAYDRSNKEFKAGVEAANLQQNTRVAFDSLVADMRMAGFDFDRDGIPTGSVGGTNVYQQPDEQHRRQHARDDQMHRVELAHVLLVLGRLAHAEEAPGHRTQRLEERQLAPDRLAQAGVRLGRSLAHAGSPSLLPVPLGAACSLPPTSKKV